MDPRIVRYLTLATLVAATVAALPARADSLGGAPRPIVRPSDEDVSEGLRVQADLAARRKLEKQLRELTLPMADLNYGGRTGLQRPLKPEDQPIVDHWRALATDYIERYPTAGISARLLGELAVWSPDAASQLALYRHVAEHFPRSAIGKIAAGKVRLAEAIGKPFDLRFHDAISGGAVSVADFKGRIVVIDFWSSRYTAYAQELPDYLELYRKFHGHGVEFIGVLVDAPEDEGGPQGLRDFVARHQIPWPQFHPGRARDSEFARAWGVDDVPRIFVIDADGMLRSTNTPRHALDALLRKLLAGRDGIPVDANPNPDAH